MPTYAYKCEECGISFERLQRFSDEPLKACPECNGPVHRVICPVGIVFKGSGFYVTDHRNKSTATLPATHKDESAAPSEPAAESKPPAADTSEKKTAAPASEPPRP